MTLAEIAHELGVSEATACRVLARALAKLLAGALEHDIEPTHFSTAAVTILQGDCKKTANPGDGSEHAPHTELPPPSSGRQHGVGRCAGLLPRRFKDDE